MYSNMEYIIHNALLLILILILICLINLFE